MKRTLLLSFVFSLLWSCTYNADKNNPKEQKISPLENYLSYSKDSSFNSSQYLKDKSGHWICVKFEKEKKDKNIIDTRSQDNRYNENFAYEFKEYFSFKIENDTIYSSIYKMPIECKKIELESLNNLQKYKDLAAIDSSVSALDFGYRIQGMGGMYYISYYKKMLGKKTEIPYIKGSPLGGWMWCFPEYIAISSYGYNWYFKKGKPKHSEIIGMPSNPTSRFIVNKTYTNSTIQEAVYKMIDDFPKGTEGLLAYSDEPNEKGEMETWFPEESGFNYGESTEYIWHNDHRVTARVYKGKNSTFVFEFIKKGNDVHVKYWNDVVFPFEEGYEGY